MTSAPDTPLVHVRDLRVAFESREPGVATVAVTVAGFTLKSMACAPGLLTVTVTVSAPL